MPRAEFLDRLSNQFILQAKSLDEAGHHEVAANMRRNAETVKRAAARRRFLDLPDEPEGVTYH
jgi:hypothetical protein